MTDVSRRRYGSLCSGIGGLDLAVEKVFGVQAAWHAEVDPTAALVHDRHWPGVPNVGDIKTADWASLDLVELICAGYPCQPFSAAGARRGDKDDRHLWPYVAEAVRVLRPRWVVLENVAGHLSLGFGTVLSDLAEAGYDAEWCCLRASDVGAPHRRERVFIVAAHAGSVRGAGRRGSGDGVDRDEAERSEAGALPASLGRSSTPDAFGSGRQGAGVEHPEPMSRLGSERSSSSDWGDYEPAIRRWEAIFGRPAPAPADARGRLAPPFVEWMMGYPLGWVTGDVYGRVKRTAALRCLGNAVVPQQGIAALSIALDAWEAAA